MQLLAPVETVEQPARDRAPRATAGDRRPRDLGPRRVPTKPRRATPPSASRSRSRSRTRSRCATRRPARSCGRSRSPSRARSRRRWPGAAPRSRPGPRVRTPSGPARCGAFRDLLEHEAEECAQLTTSEVGKPIRQSRNEVRAVLERIDWNIEHAGRGRRAARRSPRPTRSRSASPTSRSASSRT